MKIIDKQVLDQLYDQALSSPRKRANFNIHPELSDPIQRMAMVAFSGSYIRPHQHEDPTKWEIFIILDGTASILIFDDDSKVLERKELSNESQTRLIEIPPMAWHSIVIMSAHAVLIEIKPGPYKPSSDKGFASWAPSEGCEEAELFEMRMRQAHCGQKLLF